MAFLKDLGLEAVDATAIDYSVANGVYPAVISESKITEAPSTGDDLWQITYLIDPDHDSFGGRKVSEFFNLDPELPDERKAWIKRRLQSLGIGDDEAADMDPSDIVGVEVTITVKNKRVKDKTYTNISKVELGADASESAMASF